MATVEEKQSIQGYISCMGSPAKGVGWGVNKIFFLRLGGKVNLVLNMKQ